MILDAGLMTGSTEQTAQQLIEAGVRLLQYRNKEGSAREILESRENWRTPRVLQGVTFFVNDRPDIAYLSGAAGVHVGQTDLDVEQAAL